MEQMGRDLWSLDRVKTDVFRSMRESFPELFGDQWQRAGEIYKTSYRSQHLEDMQFLPGAVELIDFAYQQRIRLFIISNKIGDILRMEVENLGIADKFYSIVGSGDTEFDKPSKVPVDFALKGSGINPENDLVWFIGDAITDIECAIRSSCQPILYGEGRNVPKDLIRNKIAEEDKQMLCFNSHTEVLERLKTISKN
jgi:phosphoglycolate phosphatase